MGPAMDRVSKRLAQISGIGLGLMLGLTEFGCARLMSRFNPPEPPMLGQSTGTTDIYAMPRRSSPSTAVAQTVPVQARLNVPSTTQLEEIIEDRVTAEPIATPSATGVALQAPTSIQAQPGVRLTSATNGVPNASKLLATAEPHPVTPAQIIAQARAALDAMSSYQLSLHRQERVNGSLLPEEDVTLAIRREPRAVRLTWPSGPNQGREVLYRSDEPGGSMHVKMANPALPRLSLPPESPLVMKNSRHPVTEAGFESLVEAMEASLNAPSGSGVTYNGRESADGIDQPQNCLSRTGLSGELWKVYFDATTHLPSLVVAVDSQGQLLERYLFRDVRVDLPELTTNEAFDPTARWGPARGLFGRLAKEETSTATIPPQ